MNTNDTPVWLITGCSTGFGRELAQQVLARGWRAVVTARDPNQIQDIVAEHDGSGLALRLDVTDPRSVDAAVEKAEESFGRIDVLVNNAGYGLFAAVEEAEEDEIREQFETNFFGASRLIHAVLPGMRKRRSGSIVNISSIGGLVAFPGVAYYNATKFALEGLSEALAREVEPLGIKVMIVEPSGFRTDWAGRSAKLGRTKIDDYDATSGANVLRLRTASGKQPGDPARAAAAIIKAVTSKKPPLRLLLGYVAYNVARSKLDLMRQDFTDWRETTLGADDPVKKAA